jgi:hypothetical protein
MSDIDVNKLVRVYLKMKDAHTQMLHDFQEKETHIKSQMDQVKQALLEHCKQNNIESVKTESGTFYRTVSKKYWTNDWESFYEFVNEHKVPELLEKRIAQGNMKQFLEENPDLLPKGMNVDAAYTLYVRRAK